MEPRGRGRDFSQAAFCLQALLSQARNRPCLDGAPLVEIALDAT